MSASTFYGCRQFQSFRAGCIILQPALFLLFFQLNLQLL